MFLLKINNVIGYSAHIIAQTVQKVQYYLYFAYNPRRFMAK